MKSKTSITLSATVLKEIDRVVGRNGNRSELIEKAVHEYLHRLMREERDRRELELLNGASEKLNDEAADVLSYQVKL